MILSWMLYCVDIEVTAVYFEQGEFDKSIETCEKAVEEGRSVGDFITPLNSTS